MSSTIYLASEVAQLLDRDPIMARQLKEHLTEERLLEVLEIRAVLEKKVVDEFSREADTTDIDSALETVVEQIPLCKVLEAYRISGGGPTG